MTEAEECNNTMLKKYITKHYKIYKINPIFPVSQKLSSNIQYSVFDYEQEKEISQYQLDRYLCKIFSVDAMAVKLVLKELLNEEIARQQRLQIEIDYEGNSK